MCTISFNLQNISSPTIHLNFSATNQKNLPYHINSQAMVHHQFEIHLNFLQCIRFDIASDFSS